MRDRGRTLESVITQYLTTVKPMHEQFVEPSRKYADIIVLEGSASPAISPQPTNADTKKRRRLCAAHGTKEF